MDQSTRLPRPDDLVNTLEFEDAAKLRLAPATFDTIAGSDRSGFDRMTLHPRLLVPTLDMDLSVELFGEAQFTPILVGPAAEQRRYHADGELATARGAAAAKATMVVSSRSSVPMEKIADIAKQAGASLWFAVAPEAGARRQIDQAIAAGCKVVVVTPDAAGARPRSPTSAGAIDWKAVDDLRRGGGDIPFVIKSIMTPQQARAAIDAGARGVVVSDYGVRPQGRALGSDPAPIEVLASIVEACGSKATVLIDGSFRRGSDVVKALALGARGVLIARPVMWGLAAYGAAGVQAVVEMLQSDLGRNMGAVGASTLAKLAPSLIRVHRR